MFKYSDVCVCCVYAMCVVLCFINGVVCCVVFVLSVCM